MNEEIEVDMNGGNTVGAVKEYRNTMRKFTGIEPTLRESKEYVEKYMESLGE